MSLPSGFWFLMVATWSGKNWKHLYESWSLTIFPCWAMKQSAQAENQESQIGTHGKNQWQEPKLELKFLRWESIAKVNDLVDELRVAMSELAQTHPFLSCKPLPLLIPTPLSSSQSCQESFETVNHFFIGKPEWCCLRQVTQSRTVLGYSLDISTLCENCSPKTQAQVFHITCRLRVLSRRLNLSDNSARSNGFCQLLSNASIPPSQHSLAVSPTNKKE